MEPKQLKQPNIGILPQWYWKENEPRVREMLERAEVYNRGEYTIDDIIDGLEEEEYLLWGEIEDSRIKSIAVLNMLFFPRRKIMNMMIVVSDDMATGKARFLELMESYAADNECDAVRMSGRPGWVKTLQPFGFIEPYRILEKPVKKWSA